MKISRIIPYSVFRIPCSAKRGALLLELLIVIGLLAIILGVGTQAVYVSMQSGKISGERDVALGLVAEALEAVRAVAEEKWQNIYLLTKATEHYKPVQTASAWVLVSGDETIALNNTSYTRYLIVQNVCRETATTRNITGITDTDGSSVTACTTSGGVFDPSTQKITVTASWQGGDSIVISEYFFRWRNKATNQTSWTGTGDESVSPPSSLTTGDTLHL